MAEEIKKQNAKLALWQKRLEQSDTAYADEQEKMDERERIYDGTHEIKRPFKSAKKKLNKEAFHVQNIVFENIETEISSTVPAPKVTARYAGDEHLAEIIEHFLANERDRLPFEMMNDMAERTVMIQGGTGFFVDWDNNARTHDTIGEITVEMVHPKQFAPQPGIFTGFDDMDWFILKVPTTKEEVKRRYGKELEAEAESEPEIRSVDNERNLDDALTQYVGFEKNDKGGVNRYSWVNDIELEDMENYQARRQPVCRECGKVRPLPGQIISHRRRESNLLPNPNAEDERIIGSMAARGVASGIADRFMMGEEEPAGELMPGMDMESDKPEEYTGGACPYCGCEEFTTEEQEYEEVVIPIDTQSMQIPGAEPGFNEEGMPVMKPTLVPFYKPDAFPIVLQKNVSRYGKLLGGSDVDAIRDQQNTMNVLHEKIINRLMKAGTRVTLPANSQLGLDPEDDEKWFLENAADKSMIGVYDFSGDLQYYLHYRNEVYEEARNILGITNSFQGRTDSTANSGKAKEFAAAQSAGRLESKRVMKAAAYANLYELMFKFWLAYGDEPRTVSYKDKNGNMMFEEFNRYDFLKQDEDGNYYWNDQFLFSCDMQEPLAQNREAMWRETRENLQTGAFGDPSQTETLILFWTKMEDLHYPGAGQTKKHLEERMQREIQAQQQMLMQQQAMMQQAQGAAVPNFAPSQPQPQQQGTAGAGL